MIKNIFLKIQMFFYLVSCRLRGLYKGILPDVAVGKKLFCEKDVSLLTHYGGHINIGDKCTLRAGCKLITYGGNILIGNRCSINSYSMLYGQGNLTIGNCVRIATQCVIIPSNHNFNNPNIPIIEQGLTNKGINIEDDVWIGSGARILDGVTIAKGCIIGAGSVVTKSTEPYGIYVGVPARLIKKRK